MEYRNLGRTGLRVSDLCLGCMAFGSESGEEKSREMVFRALDAGVNFFDTANVYGRGASEEILGRALKGRRSSVVIATKYHGAMSDDVNHQVALNWVRANESITSTLVGVLTPAQLEQNLAAWKKPVPPEAIAACGQAWPQVRQVAPPYFR